MRHLVYNAIQCNICFDILESMSVHDFKLCRCGNTANDGGLHYQHIMGNNYKNLSVYSDEPFDKVRQYAYRIGYGKPGNPDYGVFRITNLCDMTDEHLQASLDYHKVTKGGTHWQLLLEEKLYRAENMISIPDI